MPASESSSSSAFCGVTGLPDFLIKLYQRGDTVANETLSLIHIEYFRNSDPGPENGSGGYP